MPPPAEDQASGVEASSEGQPSQDDTSSRSTPPPLAQDPTTQPPDSATATPMAMPTALSSTSDLPPPRPASLPAAANGHVAAVAPAIVGSASPSLPSQPQPASAAPAERPPHQNHPAPPNVNGAKGQEQLPLFGVLKATTVRPPPMPPQPPVPQNKPWSRPSMVVQPQPPTAPSSASPPAVNAIPGNSSAFNDEYVQLSALLRRFSPGVVRRVVRDNWEKCLLGTDFHSTFVTNVAVHHTTPGILQRGLSDFGNKLVEDGKYQIASLMTQKQLDEVFSILLPKVSDRFLDAAVAHRLPSIPAKRLLNHLARAERLGYDANDIEEDADEPEPLPPAPTVTLPTPQPPKTPAYHPAHIPSHTRAGPHSAHQAISYDPRQGALQTPQSTTAPPPSRQVQPPATVQNGQTPAEGGQGSFTCSGCHKKFAFASAFLYHERKAVCKANQLGPVLSQCPFCLKGFVSDGGLSYHLMNNVCGVKSGSPDDLARIKKGSSKPVSSGSSPGAPGVSPAIPQSTPHPHPQAPAPVPMPMQDPRGLPGPAPALASSPGSQPLIQSDILSSYQQPYGRAPPSSAPSTPFTPSQPNPAVPSDAALRAGSHLEPAQRLALEGEMRAAEDSFKFKIEEAKRNWDPADLERRLASLKNSHATKQSQIRKKYGIRLRTRRGPSAMMEERVRVGLPADLPTKKPTTPANQNGTTAVPFPNGSQVPNTNGKRPFDTGAVLPSPSHPPVKKLAVSELTGGLGGTSATAAMQDPTAAMDTHDSTGYHTPTPMNPSQSHFAGYSSTAPGSSGQRVQASPQRIQMGVAGRGTSREEPVDVDSSSDSGSDIEAE